jgi:hypothetical protein
MTSGKRPRQARPRREGGPPWADKAIRRKTSPWRRAFHLLAPVVVKKAGRRAAFVCTRGNIEI